MRIKSLRMHNFQGVQKFELENLETSPLVLLSGRNGTGKSTALLAISLLWEIPQNFNPYSFVGPWDSKAEVEISLHLTEDERSRLEWIVRDSRGQEGSCPEILRLGIAMTEYDQPEHLEHNVWIDTIRSKRFRSLNSFARLTMIPAERSVSRSNLGSLDPDSLSSDSAEKIRSQAVESMINQWGSFSLSSIPDYLAALDYSDLISMRGGEAQPGEGTSEYDEIVTSFLRATGKYIERPTLSREGRFAIFVDALNGNRHTIGQLSSGELQALGLMYMARRLASSGGILLVDEPEQHLHPSLQTTILEMVRDSSEGAQLWLSTHSPNLINSAPIDSIISVAPANDSDNQAVRVSRQESRLELLSDLGVTPSAWLQHDRIIIVEGSTDKRYLELLFPVETSRSLIYVAGNRAGVDATVRTLSAGEGLLPWIAVRDLDLVDPSNGTQGNCFTWSRRAFENVFLDGPILAKAIQAAAGEASPTDIEESLSSLAEAEKEEVKSLLIEERLKELVPNVHPLNRKDLDSSLSNQIELLTKRQAHIEQAKNEVHERIESNWSSEWKSLVQGKRVLAQFVRKTPFNSMPSLMSAVCKALREDSALMPSDLLELQIMISASSL
ncbi:hypothetical protein GCM10023100_44910 [Actinocorallia cavernae]|uniref:AAA+ ATPase domain-containing protein n=3 Tax=Actinomycetota TaxID=201174 RepID=A0ABN3LUK3_9ACTN